VIDYQGLKHTLKESWRNRSNKTGIENHINLASAAVRAGVEKIRSIKTGIKATFGG
jgi:hypothetical protein